MDAGCSSRITDPDFLPIPDPRSWGQKGTGSRIRNTGQDRIFFSSNLFIFVLCDLPLLVSRLVICYYFGFVRRLSLLFFRLNNRQFLQVVPYTMLTYTIITINVLVLYMARDLMILMRATSMTRAIGRGGP